eukprot:1450677-Pleurochrysis_carterae.AAC.2
MACAHVGVVVAVHLQSDGKANVRVAHIVGMIVLLIILCRLLRVAQYISGEQQLEKHPHGQAFIHFLPVGLLCASPIGCAVG